MTPKPLPYKIWKMIVTPAMFIAWVMFVAVYPDGDAFSVGLLIVPALRGRGLGPVSRFGQKKRSAGKFPGITHKMVDFAGGAW